jgi:NAD(P)-dependent dehydrogenase (short-subunit alcohol dehydrogenase family)
MNDNKSAARAHPPWKEVREMEIRGTGVLVTGASRGLGRELARVLSREGARVVMVARGEDALEAAARAIQAEGGEAHAIAADVGDKDAVLSIAGRAQALVGSIDLVVHNASILGPLPMPLLLDTACEDFGAVLEANLLGPFRLTKALASGMALRKRGLVVHVTSDAAVEGYPRWGAYGVSKAALEQLGRVWATELQGRVRFLNIDPGEMDTKMHADAMPEADRATLARPLDVAERIVAIVRAADSLSSGARVTASGSSEAAR